VNVSVNEQEYVFVADAISDKKSRESYFVLIEKVFGLDFRPWYKSGFCNNCFIPYTLFSSNIAVASVGIVINNFMWRNEQKRYAQISTVATDPDYRGRGLGRWLTERALDEWRDKCDCVYLYANDTVVDYYPKFGFLKAHEYRYHKPLKPSNGMFRKLDMSVQSDVELLIKKHRKSNPFSLFTMDDCVEIMMFHCITFLRDSIYYIEKYDAVVIAEQEDDEMFCYDIYSDGNSAIDDLLGIVASEETYAVTLGFTPVDSSGFTAEIANESDTTFFVLNDKENILADNRITFPFLSRA